MDGWRSCAAAGSLSADAGQSLADTRKGMHQRLRGILAGLSLAAVATCVLLGRLHAQAGSPAPGAGTLRVVATSPNGPVTGIVTQGRQSGSRNRWSRSAPPTRIASRSSPSRRLCPSGYHWPDTNVLVITPASGRFPFATSLEVRVDVTATSVSGRRWRRPRVPLLDGHASAAPRVSGGPCIRSVDSRRARHQPLVRSGGPRRRRLVARRRGDRRQRVPAAAALGGSAGADGARRSGGGEAVRRLDRRAATAARTVARCFARQYAGARDGTYVALRLAEAPLAAPAWS